LGKLRIRRKAVSSIIGGVIVLGLLLTALTAMVVVSQQFDTYQGTSNKMSQKDIDRSSENVKAMYPGLQGGFPATGCGSVCNQYNMSLANIGGIAVQISRIYINSTQQTSGCTIQPIPSHSNPGPCVFSPAPAIASFSFNTYDSYISPGELNHIIRLWLPATISLPNATRIPSNSIWIVTNRGRIFSFSWPFPPTGEGLPGAGVPPTIYTGTMKVAYGPSTGPGGALNSTTDSCHTEPRLTLPFGGGKTLHFVNPWITAAILSATSTSPQTSTSVYPCTQCLFVYAYASNSLSTSITFSWGSMVILTADSSENSKAYFIGGPYVGIVYNQSGVRSFATYGTPVTINPGSDFYLIFEIQYVNVGKGTFSGSGDSFSGTATMNNGYLAQAEDATFRELEIFLNGLYVRPTC